LARGERRARVLRALGQRPFWAPGPLEEYLKQRAVHRFVLALTTSATEADVARDAYLRALLCGVALLAAGGLGFAWRGLERAAELRVGLVRSEQEKAFLEEKSLAAAGLAHETRNPLNVIRGLAQVVTQDPAVPASTRSRAAELMDQADRVANRLREFLQYAKPLEATLVPTDLRALVATAIDTLETDRQDKDVRCAIDGEAIAVLADPALARQVIFNLVLNGYQAVPRGGQVSVGIAVDRGGGVELTVSDNGPGVQPEEREAIFRPYVSLHKRGTGLGLAVVRQICQAHGWRVACEAGPAGGAVFRITGIERAPGA
jgi:signal transduction histidine kinase